MEKTVDMLEAHEVDEKQADEETNQNQEAVRKVGSATGSQQRPTSWSGGSKKQRQSRPTSEVSSHHGIDEVLEHGEETPTRKPEDSGDIPDDPEVPAVSDNMTNDVSLNASEVPDVDNLEQEDNVESISEVPNVAKNSNDQEFQEEHQTNSSQEGERRETRMETPSADVRESSNA